MVEERRQSLAAVHDDGEEYPVGRGPRAPRRTPPRRADRLRWQ